MLSLCSLHRQVSELTTPVRTWLVSSVLEPLRFESGECRQNPFMFLILTIRQEKRVNSSNRHNVNTILPVLVNKNRHAILQARKIKYDIVLVT